MSDIFREIDEDLRRDRIASMARRYGGVAGGVALVVILGLGGWRFMEHRAAQQAAEAGVHFSQALNQLGENGDAAAGVRELEALAGKAPGGYEALAGFRLASEKAQHDPAGAIAAFDAMAADNRLEPGLRELARLRAALIAVDSASPQDIISRVQALAAPDSPWRNQARELIGLAWMKAGKFDEAERQFMQIAVDAAAPQSLRRRAQLFMELAAAGPVTVSQQAPAQPAPAGPAMTMPSHSMPSAAPQSGAGAPAQQQN